MPLSYVDIDVADDVEGGMLPGPTHPVKCISDGAQYVQVVAPFALTTRVDEVSSTLMYVGKAQPGASTALPYWQIMRVDTTAGVVTAFADGNTNFDNVWDDRASLTYA